MPRRRKCRELRHCDLTKPNSTVRKVISCYKDSKGLTRDLLAWIADPASQDCHDLVFHANCSMDEEASSALVHSPLAETVKALEFTEIFFSPSQLADLLTMPALVELRIWGGESSDWNGPTYVWDTLEHEHIEVLASNPHAQRLRHLDLHNQKLSEITGNELRRALPNLTALYVEGESY